MCVHSSEKAHHGASPVGQHHRPGGCLQRDQSWHYGHRQPRVVYLLLCRHTFWILQLCAQDAFWHLPSSDQGSAVPQPEAIREDSARQDHQEVRGGGLCQNSCPAYQYLSDRPHNYSLLCVCFRVLGSKMGTPLGGIPMLLAPMSRGSLADTVQLCPSTATMHSQSMSAHQHISISPASDFSASHQRARKRKLFGAELGKRSMLHIRGSSPRKSRRSLPRVGYSVSYMESRERQDLHEKSQLTKYYM